METERYYLVKSYRYFSNSEYTFCFAFINEKDKELIELLQNVNKQTEESDVKLSKRTYYRKECEEMIKEGKLMFYNPELSAIEYDEINEIYKNKPFEDYLITEDNIIISSYNDSEKIKNILNKRKLLKDIKINTFDINCKASLFIFYVIMKYYSNENKIKLFGKKKLFDELLTIFNDENIINFILDYLQDKLGINTNYDNIYNELSDKYYYWSDIETDFSFIAKQFIEDIKLTIHITSLIDKNLFINVEIPEINSNIRIFNLINQKINNK